MKRLAGLVGVFAACLVAQAAMADWFRLNPSEGFGQGAAACFNGGENFQCIAVRCTGGPAVLSLIAGGGDFGSGGPMPVFLRIDTGPAVQVQMVPVAVSGTLQADMVLRPDQHGLLLAALKGGSRLTATNWQDKTVQSQMVIGLGNGPDALGHALSVCALEAGSAGAGPDLRNYATVPLASVPPYLAAAVADVPSISEVRLSEEAVLPNGARMIAAEIAAGMWFGMSGFGVYVFAALPGQPYRLVWSGVGTMASLNARVMSNGLPELRLTPVRGMNPKTGIWQFDGAAYQHIRNIP